MYKRSKRPHRHHRAQQSQPTPPRLSSSPSSSLLGVVGEVSADVFPLVSALPLSSTVSTESIAQRGPTPPITPSVHRLSESHHRHPSRGRSRIRSSSSGRHPARPVPRVLMSLRRRRAPVRRSRLIVRARWRIRSPVHRRRTARRTPRTRRRFTHSFGSIHSLVHSLVHALH